MINVFITLFVVSMLWLMMIFLIIDAAKKSVDAAFELGLKVPRRKEEKGEQ